VAARPTVLAAGVLILAGAAVYANSFAGAFVYDDTAAILRNPTIRHLGRLGTVLAPPGDQAGTVGGRPLVNLSLAINYALGGTRPWGYHAVNLGIHLLAALVLFGVVRRTFARPPPGKAAPRLSGGAGTATALGAALLWTLHPLQTESVTYVIQRAESLMGLLYLLTLYAFIRHVDERDPGRSRRWAVLGLATCLLGMAAKEVMVTAPLMVLLYDRTFVAGSFRASWGRRRGFYLGLASSWILLAVLVASTHGRGGSAGLAAGTGAWPYALTQCGAVLHYLRLVVWPVPLVFDYGTGLVETMGAVTRPAALLVLLLAATAWALWRRPALGFLGAWFFVILAPTSSLVVIATEPVAEHRLYLPLAAATVLAAVGLQAALERWGPRAGRPDNRAASAIGALAGCAGFAAVLGLQTVQRNRDYRSPEALWRATVQAVPGNPRAHNDLGSALVDRGAAAEAAAEFAAALRLQPGYLPAHYNLGALLLGAGRPQEAIPHLERAVGGSLHLAEANRYLGEALAKSGRGAEAVGPYQAAARLDPSSVEAAFGLGNALAVQGRYQEAIPEFRRAVALAPGLMRARNNLANALLFAGRVDDAILEYQRALQLRPDDPAVRDNLARALLYRRTGSAAAAR